MKKEVFYEVNVQSFADRNLDGIGDLKGFYSKIDYFKHLGVQNVIFKDVLNMNEQDENQSFLSVSPKVGNINDFKKSIEGLSLRNIRSILELEIGNIRENHRWFKNAVSSENQEFSGVINFKNEKTEDVPLKYSKDTRQYYVVDQETQEVPLNWLSDKVIDNFIKIIRFWYENGVTGFVLTGFEFLADETKKNILNEETKKQLRKFYNAIKQIDESIFVIGRSDKITFEMANELIETKNKTFDFMIADLFYKNGLSNKYGSDQIGSFSIKELLNNLKKWSSKPSQIISFSSPKTGRFNERWAGNKNYQSFSAKAFAMLQIVNPASTLIHYGDEIGVFNIGLTYLDDFKDVSLKSRKRSLGSRGVANKSFMEAQIFQNPINFKSLMPWSSEKNGGFSNSEKTIVPVNFNYKNVNVSEQYADGASTLNFYIKLIKKFSNLSDRKYKDFKKSYKLSMGNLFKNRKIFISQFEISKEKFTILTNPTDKTRRMSAVIYNNVETSSYYHKTYLTVPYDLQPYETIISTTMTKKDFDKTMETSILRDVESYKEKMTNDFNKNRKQIVDEINQNIKKQKNELKRMEKEVQKDIAKKDKYTKELELIRVKMDSINSDQSKKEQETKLESLKENIEKKIIKEQDNINQIKEKAKHELEEKLKATEAAIWDELSEKDKTKLREDELAFTTLIEDDSDLEF